MCIENMKRNIVRVLYDHSYSLEREELSECTKEARKFEIEILEAERLDLKGEKREEALKAYHKLLLSSADEPIYLMRSE